MRWAGRRADPPALTSYACNVHIAHMAIKTVSLKQEAYDRLRAARRYPTESFSEVILRATWPEDTITGRGLLSLMGSAPAWFSEGELEAMAAAKAGDAPPEDKWTER